MIKVTEKTKIFVYCPSGVVTGGAELLHQLVHVLNENNKKAYIVYFALPGKEKTNIIPKDYQKYNIRLADKVEDSTENIIVFYEGIFDMVLSVKEAQLFLWWLSVDHFFLSSEKYLSLSDFFKWNFKKGISVMIKRLGQLLIKRKNYFRNNLSLKDLQSRSALHGYQSEYAQNFLQNNGFSEMLSLKDFINDEFFEEKESIKKEDLILYNPKKGMEYTQKVINKYPQYKWVALQNMTRSEMISYLNKAKIYIDFGYHPGKDRIPREAVMSGACVLTNYKGSAAFFEDVPIDKKYKFNNTNENIVKIGHLIRNIMDDYDAHNLNFDFYRDRVKKEKKMFEKEVLDLFFLLK